MSGGVRTQTERKQKMKRITATSKKNFEELKKEYRNKGYHFVTFGTKLAEMEDMTGNMVVIERK